MLQRKEVIDKIRLIGKDSIPEGGRMFLFGSQARGDAHEDSDWDILILLNKSRIENKDFGNNQRIDKYIKMLIEQHQ